MLYRFYFTDGNIKLFEIKSYATETEIGEVLRSAGYTFSNVWKVVAITD